MTLTRWEYKTFVFASSFWTGRIDMIKLESQLNEYGREGWELINGTFNSRMRPNGVLFTLKRQRA